MTVSMQASFSVLPQVSPGYSRVIVPMVPRCGYCVSWPNTARRFVAVLVHQDGVVHVGYHARESHSCTPCASYVLSLASMSSRSALVSGASAALAFVMGTTGTFALFLLLFGQWSVQLRCCCLWLTRCVHRVHACAVISTGVLILGCVALFCAHVLHSVIFGTRLPFLPLMVMSLYRGGLVWPWWLSFRLVWAASDHAHFAYHIHNISPIT